MLDCECIYYQRVYPNGDLDPQIGIYRGGEDRPCESCMAKGEVWKDRAVGGMVIYNPKG